MKESGDKPKRRVRYKGTHPRGFSEKYKELNPEKYPDEIKKALGAGKTPAGTHRPICLNEILEFLNPRPGHEVVDATLGFGGHTLEILKRVVPNGRVIGFDLDSIEILKTEARIRAEGFDKNTFVSVNSNFAELPEALEKLNISKVNLLLADLGVSSMQLDNPERGFSFKLNGPLDLRMNPTEGQTAAHFLKTLNEKDLVTILEENADEIYAVEIARSITLAKRKAPIKTTGDLTMAARAGLAHLPKKRQAEEGNRPIRRVFQALRIAVNQEFEHLESFLENIPTVLSPGGKVAILTFHSGEDRRVKKAFKEGFNNGSYSLVAKDVIRPSSTEIYTNPRASSAKLRWAVRR